MRSLASFAMFPLTAALVSLSACGTADEPEDLDPLARETTGIYLQVAYMPDAEPYMMGTDRFPEIWAITRSNMEAVFVDKVVRIDSTLSTMTALSDTGRESFTASEIFDLAEMVPDERRPGEARFVALWLDGFYEESGEVRENVLGVSLGGTTIVAMFKPVIETSERDGNPLVAAFVEQSTLVHELGHAIGLVNNGIALTADHHDAENGAHCTNRDCVMYYRNEGLADLRDFVRRYIRTSETVLFGPDCLRDVAAAAASNL